MLRSALHRPRSSKAPGSLAALLGLLFLMGADGCPLTTDPPSAGGSSGSVPGIDIGGSSGALWALTYGSDLRVTLRTGTQSASASVVPATSSVATVLGRTIDLSSFCWRTDVVCPHQVLTNQTMVVQSTSTNQLVVGFNRKGPLAALSDPGLLGTLQGSDLTVPLGMQPGADPCTLAVGSAVSATVSVPAGESRADAMDGLVTLRYSGECVTLGGNGALYDTDQIELTVRFAGTRQ